VLGLARLIGSLQDGAVVHILAAAAAADRSPEIIQYLAVETDALAPGKPDDPDTQAFVFRQQRRADARIRVFDLARELGGDVGWPLRDVSFLGRNIPHGHTLKNSNRI
jgi:hypothetical protein